MKNLILVIIVFLSFKSAAQIISVAGTANQVIASGSTGTVTLSLPQSIATTNNVQFSKAFFTDRLSIGTNSSPSIANYYNNKIITGSTAAYSNYTQATIQSDVTSSAYGYRSVLYTQAASFNLLNLIHYSAGLGSIGVGSSVNEQVGFYAENTLIGATSNYGFYGGISSGVNRWNLFMNGTAQNYLAGNLGIGIKNPTEKLSVNGNIRAKEVRVEASPWPDYVFQKDYKLQPLSEVEKFIHDNQHLPEIPSASEVEKDGLSLGEMDAKLLKKIEELTLHLIELNKIVIDQQKEIQN